MASVTASVIACTEETLPRACPEHADRAPQRDGADLVARGDANREGPGLDDRPGTASTVPVPDLLPRTAAAAEEHAAGVALRPEHNRFQRRSSGDVHGHAEAAAAVRPDPHQRLRQPEVAQRLVHAKDP